MVLKKNGQVIGGATKVSVFRWTFSVDPGGKDC